MNNGYVTIELKLLSLTQQIRMLQGERERDRKRKRKTKENLFCLTTSNVTNNFTNRYFCRN